MLSNNASDYKFAFVWWAVCIFKCKQSGLSLADAYKLYPLADTLRSHEWATRK